MNWIQKYQLGKSLNKRIYNAIDPTEGYPTLLGLGKHALNIGLGTEVKKMDEPVADAAWKKRLKLDYDKNLLPGNPDGSVRLPKSYENQFMVDTVGVKKRIKDIIGMYGSEEELKKYDADAEAFLRKDREYLDKLRHMYKGNKIVVNEFDVWKGRTPIPKGISPFSLMQNFTLEYNPKTRKVSYYDVYDFNKFEPFVPGKPFTISGTVPKRQLGGKVKGGPDVEFGNLHPFGHRIIFQKSVPFTKTPFKPGVKIFPILDFGSGVISILGENKFINKSNNPSMARKQIEYDNALKRNLILGTYYPKGIRPQFY